MTQYILDNYKCDLKGEYGKIPLRLAVETGNLTAAKLLIFHGAEPDSDMIKTALKDLDLGLAFFLTFSNITLVGVTGLIILITIMFIVVWKKSYKTNKHHKVI